MKARYAVLVAIAAAVTVTSVGAAAPEGAKQRVAITVNGVADGSLSGKFVFNPLQAGILKRDSGTEQSFVAKERSLVRDGQSVKVVTWVSTAKGKHGTFVIREVINNVDAGNGAGVGTGTWTFVRGTGQYAGLTGGGRLGQVDLYSRDRTWSERREGFLTLP
jgi:hypothetical protein